MFCRQENHTRISVFDIDLFDFFVYVFFLSWTFQSKKLARAEAAHCDVINEDDDESGYVTEEYEEIYQRVVKNNKRVSSSIQSDGLKRFQAFQLKYNCCYCVHYILCR